MNNLLLFTNHFNFIILDNKLTFSNFSKEVKFTQQAFFQ